MKKINCLDLFSGIGGFHLGLEQAGFEFDYVGFSDIDKYANKQYKKRFPNATELGSVTDIQCEQLPKHIDILCGGFPCQSFSIAGLRGGFEDTRGTLFFEIVRILRYYKESGNPIPCFILENVKGLLSHDDGKTFATIYGVLADLDYSVECQLLNTRWFLPQNRERIYIVGHFGGEPRRKVFPIGEINKEINELQGQFTNTLKARYEAIGDGSYIIEGKQYAQAVEVKPILTSHKDQNGRHIKEDGEDMFTLNTSKDCGVMIEEKKINKTQYGKHQQDAIYETENSIAPTLMSSGDGHMGGAASGYLKYRIKSSIRRLTPTECERLQGFPDGWTEGQSDTQRYKQLGNAVSVPVVKVIGEKLVNVI